MTPRCPTFTTQLFALATIFKATLNQILEPYTVAIDPSRNSYFCFVQGTILEIIWCTNEAWSRQRARIFSIQRRLGSAKIVTWTKTNLANSSVQ